MTELQLKIRRLVHRVSAFKKKGKDFSAVAAELEQLRAQRKAEGASEKKPAEKAKKVEDVGVASGASAAPAEAPANG